MSHVCHADVQRLWPSCTVAHTVQAIGPVEYVRQFAPLH